MTRIMPETQYPTRRLIVFAGSENNHAPPILARTGVSAIMASFQKLRSAKFRQRWNEDFVPVYDSWPQYRFLDSGAYTLLRRNRKKSEMKRVADSLAKKSKVLSEAELVQHYREYSAYLKENLHLWDFVIDIDIHPMQVERSNGQLEPGYIFAENARRKLREIAGEKLLPVWHVNMDRGSPWPYFRSMIAEYKYVAISAAEMASKSNLLELRQLIDLAHENGVLVHLLGTTRLKALQAIPADTADSTTWLAIFGRLTVGGTRISDIETKPAIDKAGKVNWPRPHAMAKAMRLADKFEKQYGWTAEEVAGSYTKRVEAAAGEFFAMEAILPPVTKPIRREALIESG